MVFMLVMDVAKIDELRRCLYKDILKNGVAVVSDNREATDANLDHLNELIECVRMKFRARKSRSAAFVKRVQNE